MDSVRDERTLLRPGSPIRTSSDRCLLAAPRGLSQLATSFIASRRQGIHRSLLVACPLTVLLVENIAWLHSRIFVFGCQRSREYHSPRSRRRFTPGGDDRIRTGDPLLAKQVLFHLSYIPADKTWWAFLGSNQGPRAYQARALAT